jgi:hypothetical protein
VSASGRATPRHAGLAVLAFAATLLAVIGLGLVLQSGNRELQTEYAVKAQLLDGLRRTGAANIGKTGKPMADGAAIVAPSETIAASTLQKQIVDRLNAAGGVVQSVQAEPAREATAEGRQQRLVARLSFESSATALQHLLFALETGAPFIFVDTLAAQPAAGGAPGTRAEGRLRVTLAVSSYWKNGTAGPGNTENAASALPWLKLDDLSATRDRPIFAPDRRPPVVVSPPTEPPVLAEAEPEFEAPIPIPALKGIIVQGSLTLVVLEDRTTAESIVVRSGDRFGPWQVVAENDRSVRLAAGGEQVLLDLYALPQDDGRSE